MECVCEMLPYPHPHQAHAPGFYIQQPQPQTTYPTYMQHPQQMEEYHVPYGGPEYADFGYPHGGYYEELEEMNGEPSTRPRLTKDQVEVLEAQFQANHKPSSVVKRQLAMQTMLSLPRVANWFQNRRAKAKQQKKQEEFESSQAQQSSPDDGPTTSQLQESPVQDRELQQRNSPVSGPSRPSTSPSSAVSTDVNALKQSRLASYASVDRLMAQQPSNSVRPASQVVTSDQLQHPKPVYPHYRSMSAAAKPQVPQWPKKANDVVDGWTDPPQHFQDTSFDFGFSGNDTVLVPASHDVVHSTPNEASFEHSILTSEAWTQMQIAQPLFRDEYGPNGDLQSPCLPSPIYHDSRRGSGAESLAANFGSFALATPVDENDVELGGPELPQPEIRMDLAARRKRPRPAALTSDSLRSRSSGALTTMSPVVRSGLPAPGHHLRSVKSTGHSLNARYAGIRKPSSAQRSPMNATFTEAEAEAYHRLLAQHSADQGHLSSTGIIGSATPTGSPGLTVDTQVDETLMAHQAEVARSYQLAASQHLTLATSSPPATPFGSDYSYYNVPPVSAPAQYASFADYTPPYSAGPLTNSSWPDAPLTSPDMPSFPSHSFGHMSAVSHGSDPGSQHHQQFVLPSDGRLGFDINDSTVNTKPPEFYIQEFPKQKEEHAHAAQQLARNRPKNYVFANTAPSDYDQT